MSVNILIYIYLKYIFLFFKAYIYDNLLVLIRIISYAFNMLYILILFFSFIAFL